MKTQNSLFGPVIHTYTRAQAIADGELVDVSEMAKKTGFKIPVAVTSTVWDQYIEWTNEDSDTQITQDQAGRLWDVLMMLYVACRRSTNESCICYRLRVVIRDGRSKKNTLITLKAVVGGGDEGEPVITIMLPNED